MHTNRSTNADSQPAPTCPALVDLAAYLDSRAAENEADAIELHLANCSTCLEMVREYGLMQAEDDQSLMLVPPRVIEHAMALMPARSTSHWWITSRRAAAIAATVAICAVGYQVGAAIAMPSASLSATDENANAFLGLFEDDEADSADDLLFAEGEVS